MILFLKILLAHIIGDFCFQPESWIKEKEAQKHKSVKLYLHILVHSVALALLLGFDRNYWLGFIIIISIHLMKLNSQKKIDGKLLFFTDQGLHICIITGVAYLYQPFNIGIDVLNPKVLLFVICILFVTYAAAIIIKVLLSTWTPHTEEKEDESLAKAGRFIGLLERTFVFVFIITQHWEGVGFLLAAKSIFRFGDLKESKDRKLTEYILIGTLLSFGIAVITGLIFEYLKTIIGNI
jgi:hypothetical protein